MSKLNLEKYMLLLSIVGALLSFYLFYTDVVNIEAICPTGGCAVVANSEYSKFIGIHVSLWGLLYYCGFAISFMFKDSIAPLAKHFLKITGFYLLIGILFTLYLRYVELFIIRAFCIWCWGSVLVMVLLTILYLIYYRKNEEVIQPN